MIWSKKDHFLNFFFWQYRQGKYVLRYSRTKNAFLGYKNKKFKKSNNWHFSKGVNPWFWSKNAHFSTFSFEKVEKLKFFSNGLTHGFCPKMAIFKTLFLGNISQEKVFYDILERKNACVGYKNKKFKKSKNWHFSKWVTRAFGPNMVIFFILFFLGNIS